MNKLFAATDMHISLIAEPLFSLGPLTVTNAMVTGAIALVILLISMFYVAGKLKKGQTNFFVGLVRWTFDGMYGQVRSIITDQKLARSIMPLALTIFFFVLINYWMSIIPGAGTITWDGVPIFRAMTADLNFTFALALITVIAVQFYAIKKMGVIGNLHRYFVNPFKNPIGAFEGILELVGEFSKALSLSFRLFGNAFAGEILLMVSAILTSYFATVTVPIFMAFELFIGFIQAYVFFILTVIFTSLAQEHGGDHNENHSTEEPHTSLQKE